MTEYIEEKISHGTPFKKLEPGEIIQGQIVEFFAGQFGACVVISQDGEKIALGIPVGMSPIQTLPVGTMVKIVFHGLTLNPKTSRQYNKYDVIKLVPVAPKPIPVPIAIGEPVP